MTQRRYSTRIEKEEAVVVASMDFWDEISAHFRELAYSDRGSYGDWIEIADHIDSWVERTRFKHKDER